MTEVLSKYLPQAAVIPTFELIKNHEVHLKIVKERVTRHGDYRKLPDGRHQVTVNASLNKYRFLRLPVSRIFRPVGLLVKISRLVYTRRHLSLWHHQNHPSRSIRFPLKEIHLY